MFKGIIRRLLATYRTWQHARQYTYGTIYRPDDGYYSDNVRRNRRTGSVEFVMWPAGEQGHLEDYWVEMGYGWELYFTPTKTVNKQ